MDGHLPSVFAEQGSSVPATSDALVASIERMDGECVIGRMAGIYDLMRAGRKRDEEGGGGSRAMCFGRETILCFAKSFCGLKSPWYFT
jgi:hypothetical protein